MVRDIGQPDCSAPRCLIQTLKRRADFLRIRGGARWGTPAFLIESKPRRITDEDGGDAKEDHRIARFGYTVTKRQGNAVIRNRMRRRLKEVVRLVGADHARPGYDYVVVARASAHMRAFAALTQDMIDALQRLAQPARQGRRQRK